MKYILGYLLALFCLKTLEESSRGGSMEPKSATVNYAKMQALNFLPLVLGSTLYELRSLIYQYIQII